MAKAKFLTLEKKSVLTWKSKLGFGSQHSPTPCGSAFHILTGLYWSVPTLLSPPSYLSSFRGTPVLGGLFTRPLHEWEMHENMVLFSGFCLIMIAPVYLHSLMHIHTYVVTCLWQESWGQGNVWCWLGTNPLCEIHAECAVVQLSIPVSAVTCSCSLPLPFWTHG